MRLSDCLVRLIARLFEQVEKGKNFHLNLFMFLVAILSLSFFLYGARIGDGFRQVPPDPLYFRKIGRVLCGCWMGGKEKSGSPSRRKGEEEGGVKGGFVMKEASKQRRNYAGSRGSTSFTEYPQSDPTSSASPSLSSLCSSFFIVLAGCFAWYINTTWICIYVHSPKPSADMFDTINSGKNSAMLTVTLVIATTVVFGLVPIMRQLCAWGYRYDVETPCCPCLCGWTARVCGVSLYFGAPLSASSRIAWVSFHFVS